jgi:hypothetical protein
MKKRISIALLIIVILLIPLIYILNPYVSFGTKNDSYALIELHIEVDDYQNYIHLMNEYVSANGYHIKDSSSEHSKLQNKASEKVTVILLSVYKSWFGGEMLFSRALEKNKPVALVIWNEKSWDLLNPSLIDALDKQWPGKTKVIIRSENPDYIWNNVKLNHFLIGELLV